MENVELEAAKSPSEAGDVDVPLSAISRCEVNGENTTTTTTQNTADKNPRSTAVSLLTFNVRRDNTDPAYATPPVCRQRDFNTTSTGGSIKSEPDVDDGSDSTPRREDNKRCRHDTAEEASSSSERRCIHFTTSHPPLSFSHRPDCPCPPPGIRCLEF